MCGSFWARIQSPFIGKRTVPRFLILAMVLFAAFVVCGASRVFAKEPTNFPKTLTRIKQSVVGVGVYDPAGVPPYNLLGTGFAVQGGLTIVTCAHIIRNANDLPGKGFLAVFPGAGFRAGARRAVLQRIDDQHDVAILAIGGDPLPSLTIEAQRPVQEGEMVAFTGFPIGQLLGIFPVTHRGMVSALTPIVQPAMRGLQLNPTVIRQLQDPFTVIQLDGTAYPGNSGGPLYDMDSGAVVGMINMVFVKERKEYALSSPSGISFAIPSIYIEKLLAARR